MLEHPGLSLTPWIPCREAATPLGEDPGSRLRRLIAEWPGGRPAGFVCRRLSNRPRWLQWLLRPRRLLEVHEIEDEPLLFTLACVSTWSIAEGRFLGRQERASHASRWDLRDADGRWFGKLEKRSLTLRERPRWAMADLALAIPEPPCRVVVVLGKGPLQRVLLVRSQEEQAWRQRIWTGRTAGQPGWTEAAPLQGGDERVTLVFPPGLEQEPFGKMLLLGAVLIATDDADQER